MRTRSAQELAALFGKAPGDSPDVAMIHEVNALLHVYGRYLPMADQPPVLSTRPWQRQGLASLCREPYWVYEAARQAGGKSTICSVYLAADLILANPWCVGMPTLEQASSIVLHRTQLYMKILEKPLGMRRRLDNVRHMAWEHGADIRALSTNEAGVFSSQGYTRRGVLIDEGHELPFSSLGYFTPLVLVAMKKRRGKMIVIGPAGTMDSTIERVKGLKNYHVEYWPDERIIEMDDARRATLPPGHPELKEQSWRERFAEEEETTDPATYNQFYRLIPVTSGGLLIFPNLREESQSWRQHLVTRHYTIDVGKTVDSTICAKWDSTPATADLLETRRWHGLDYSVQARELIDYITADPAWHPHNVGLEVNGPGEPLADIMGSLDPRFKAIRRIKTTDNSNGPGQMGRKTRWLKAIIGRNIRGDYGVREKNVRTHLAALGYTVNDNGRYDWPHSDELSVCWLREALAQTAVGV